MWGGLKPLLSPAPESQIGAQVPFSNASIDREVFIRFSLPSLSVLAVAIVVQRKVQENTKKWDSVSFSVFLGSGEHK